MLVGLSALAIILGLVIGFTLRQPTTIEVGSKASAGAVRERYVFDSLESLVRGADAIVVGTVIQVQPGRLAGDPEDGPGGMVQMFDVSVTVDETLRGGVSGAFTLEIMPIASPGGLAGYPAFDPAQPWWKPGSQSVFFVRKGLEERLIPLGSQGLMFLPHGAANGELEVVAESDFGPEVEALGFATLEQRIEAIGE